MPMHISNWQRADIGTGIAAVDMAQQGLVCKITDAGDGRRTMTPIGDGEDALCVPGNIAVAMKIGTDANEVDSSDSSVATRLGSRIVSIKSGDNIMCIREGAKIVMTLDLVDASLDPARSGTAPTVGQDIAVKGSKLSTVAAASPGIPTPVMFRVYEIKGSEYTFEFLYF